MEAMLLCLSLWMGVPVPAEPPEVLYQSQGEVWDRAHRRVRAFYLPGRRLIVMGVTSKPVLAHEVVHYLQDLNGLPFDEDQAWVGADHWLWECRV